jgi:tetratricopeptide (TPR) repeat protein
MRTSFFPSLFFRAACAAAAVVTAVLCGIVFAAAASAELPADPAEALLYAKSIPDGAAAVEAYKKIAADTSFPDSVRGEAYFRLGCAAYMKGRYQKAGQYLKKSGRPATDPGLCTARFLAAVHDTADSAFLTSLTKVAADSTGQDSRAAQYFLGLFFLAKKDFTRSLSHFDAASGGASASDTAWWSCAAYAGACYSALSLGRSEEAQSVLRHLKRVYPAYLEKAQLAKIKPSTASLAASSGKDTTAWLPPDTAAAKKDARARTLAVRVPSAHKPMFSLQVGAFGSVENAGSLKSDLAKRYSPVSVVAAIVQDKPLYRVRVGVFASRESAQAFADTALAKKGLKFRIVEDEPSE